MVDKETKKPKYVVITDGLSPMNILFYSAVDGKLYGKEKVDFGIENLENS